MFTDMGARKYTKNKRADQQEETRARIVAAVVALHEELGPANTSIKAIAERAGVQRLTVYRYFPDEESLFQACTSSWLKANPPPNIADWAHIDDAYERSYSATLAFNKYYRRTASMWNGAYRDVDAIPALQGPMAGFESYRSLVCDDLLAAWKLSGKEKKQCLITLRHCLLFTTWASLSREQLQDKQITELMMRWIG